MKIIKEHTSPEIHTLDNYLNPFKNNNKPNNYYLSEYFKSIYSQHGEDGLLQYIFSVVKPRSKYFVEFGVQHGNSIENTRNLRLHHEWTGLLMEGNLKHVIESNGLVKHEWITSKNIMELFEKYNVPFNLDLLSIDIDGDDIYVFNSIDTNKYKPIIIIGEYNPSLPNHLPLTIVEGKSDYGKDPYNNDNSKNPCYHGCNIHAWYIIAKSKGYTMLTTCGVNVILISNEYINYFNPPELNDLVVYPYFRKEDNRFKTSCTLTQEYKWCEIN